MPAGNVVFKDVRYPMSPFFIKSTMAGWYFVIDKYGQSIAVFSHLSIAQWFINLKYRSN